jgi:hypothetical protein
MEAFHIAINCSIWLNSLYSPLLSFACPKESNKEKGTICRNAPHDKLDSYALVSQFAIGRYALVYYRG